MGEGFFTDAAKKFMHDGAAVGKICHSTPISKINFEEGVDAIFMTGGHGTVVDYVSNPALKSAIETMYNGGKVVGTVCHGPMCLVDCVKKDGTPLVEGLEVTGFSNEEEEAVQMTSMVPFLLESKFKEQGGIYSKADSWNSKVCVAGKLVTGQNPQSSEECAKAVVKLLE
mmetsp:Transcript_24346/g.29872  ORF Transcript_24346/g.29872 Transcript_24346/m.29872 type:complete len:170 (-) Transcript_24346:73-582(-)